MVALCLPELNVLMISAILEHNEALDLIDYHFLLRG